MPTKEFTCQSAGVDCDFMMRSEKESELLDFVKQHAEDVHNMDMSRSDIRDALTTV
jgi:predicted small metal-binding protein